ncbi:DNA-binding response regulator [Rhizocola hellebori]|uniref:DNA-binding response regulator n=1 Tax=Rhizocola hellebori TaxID=1392758 RepID=A0A8J3QET3_9ACTN|nr:response regulator transcription factor [Rhizocola hellebori]GIH07986.1 DNA-binding response regulator [Rhizocola hellebori]
MVRVLIVDDSDIVRRGLTTIIDTAEGFQVVGTATDGRDALTVAGRLKPDLVLMDIRMPGLDGLAATRELMSGESPPRIVILTTFNDDEYITEAVAAGAVGFMLKDAPPEQLLRALRAAADGLAMLDPAVTMQVMSQAAQGRTGTQLSDEEDQMVATLTDREREVLGLLGQGLSNADIGTALFMTEGTVKGHVSAIFSKLNVTNRVQAARLAFRAGLDEPE